MVIKINSLTLNKRRKLISSIIKINQRNLYSKLTNFQLDKLKHKPLILPYPNQQNTSNFSCFIFFISSFSSACHTLNLTSKNCNPFIFLIISTIPYFDNLFDIKYKCETLSKRLRCLVDSDVSWLFVMSKYVRFVRVYKCQAPPSVNAFLLQERSHNVVTWEMCLSASSLRLLFRMSSTFSDLRVFMFYKLYAVNLLFARFSFYKFSKLEHIIVTEGLPNKLSLRIKALRLVKPQSWRISLSVSSEAGRSIYWVWSVTVISRRDMVVGFFFTKWLAISLLLVVVSADQSPDCFSILLVFRQKFFLATSSCSFNSSMVFSILELCPNNSFELSNKLVSPCCLSSITAVRSSFYFLNNLIFFCVMFKSYVLQLALLLEFFESGFLLLELLDKKLFLA